MTNCGLDIFDYQAELILEFLIFECLLRYDIDFEYLFTMIYNVLKRE
jgi:hypothetical protein